MVKITLPDGSILEKKEGITPAEIAKEIGEGLLRAALAAKANNVLVDLNHPINSDSKLEIITFKQEEGKKIYWHSTSHILAAAVKKLYPEVKFGIGPAINEGFYYDFDNVKFSSDDLEKIEAEIKSIIKKDIKFERKKVSKEKAKEIFKDEKLKLELIDDLEDDDISIYTMGDFSDLCKGPHVPSSGKIGYVKLLKLAGAYWKGDSKNKMLQRIYGISFAKKSELNSFVELKKKAEENDHRKIGREQDLYSFHEEAPGMPFFHPKGMIIWNELIKFWKEEHDKAGYVEVKTPIIMNKKLWETSGHWDKYRNNMYFTEIDDVESAVKPMNCPGGMLIYKTRKHSYREFPMKVAEIGLVHRHELSGVLSGLFRVRSFHQDDAHIFMTSSQITQEVIKVINLIDKFYKTFGFEYHMELSTRPKNSIGTDEQWESAENGLKKALEELKIDYKLNPGDGAFYGPKIDFHIKDALGRTWQCGTIQLDMTMPEKFDISYVDEENKEKRAVIIHRTVYGSLERFLGVLVEHYGGVFPLWLSPSQVRILTVSDKFIVFAKKINSKLLEAGIRSEIDQSSNTLEYKVRNSELEKIPYTITIGEKEEKNNTLAVRPRGDKVKFGVKLDEFSKQLLEQIKQKK